MRGVLQIAVIGAGQMGSGIAQVSAEKGFRVQLIDVNRDVLNKACEVITFSLEKRFSKKHIGQTPQEILKNIYFSCSLENVAGCELVVEAIPENIDLKKKLFQKISKLIEPSAILVSNTSSISITKLASVSFKPERTAGLHFMNPVPLMPLVEVIKAKQTSDSVFKYLLRFVDKLGKEAVTSEDQPGFIVNRILMPMINEAIFALQSGVAKVEEIDKAMKLGCHHPMGPLALADLIGLDTCLSIMEVLHEGLGDKYQPCALLKKYVASNWLGKKTKKGFYTY